ncbi:hypothetical protein ACFP9V_20155 [Deinococcus radiopugnans]|uniref:hypothetical protein n=1 Tax=Deinococcus radiopugnans TaxID=57497 RepID=UPI00361EF4B4
MPGVPLALSALLVVFLVLPVLALLLRGLNAQFLPTLLGPVVLDALRISLLTTSCTMVLTVLLGTPVAWLLARYDFPGKTALDTLLDLPIVLPPVVAGVGLLLAFGRSGLLGAPLELAGISVAFSPAAVVLAQLFVAAPFTCGPPRPASWRWTATWKTPPAPTGRTAGPSSATSPGRWPPRSCWRVWS